MAEATVPVDLFNPGQVFACLGFVEAIEILKGNAAGRFTWEDDAATFILSANGDENPVGTVLRFLETAEVSALRPTGSEIKNGKGIPTADFLPAGSYPTTSPKEKARLIARLRDGADKAIDLMYWGEIPGQSNVKFWGGNRTAPGIAEKALSFCKGVDISKPFQHTAKSGGVFRFDPAGSYLPIDIGFSLNEHKKNIANLGFPVTELLAALGATHARPISYQHKVSYRYRVYIETPLLSPIIMRAMLSSFCNLLPGHQMKRFDFKVRSPSTSSAEYCITDIQELPQEVSS